MVLFNSGTEGYGGLDPRASVQVSKVAAFWACVTGRVSRFSNGVVARM